VVTDPPYGETSCSWDRLVPGWAALVGARNVWCFGSLKAILDHQQHEFAGWTRAQEIVWEKHNGSSFHADRFKRVHEFAVHWYRGEWGSIYKEPPVTLDATPRTVRRKQRPPHTGHIEAGSYRSEDGGPRLMRSVIYCRSEHGSAVNETQKPLGILRPLISYSCPPDGLVLDPFSGAGSTLLAARDLGRRAVGVELREEQCEATVQRLGQGILAV
jgi:site-specific DNA-methyltransferase (adenine-specific)